MSGYKPHIKKVGKDSYKFRLGFEVIRRLQDDHGLGSMDIMTRANEGAITPTELLSVIMCCLENKNGQDVREADIEAESIAFIDAAGYMAAFEIAREIFIWGQIGSVKKLQVERANWIERAADTYITSLWKTSLKAGALWVAVLVTSTTLICSILKALEMGG